MQLLASTVSNVVISDCNFHLFFFNQTVSLAHQYLEFWGAFKTSMDANIGAYPHAIASVVSYV